MKQSRRISAAVLFLVFGNIGLAYARPAQGRGQQDQNNQQGQQRAEQVHDRNDQRKSDQQQQRLSQQEQQRRIQSGQRNMTAYQRNLDSQVRLSQQRTAQLQQQKRVNQYRFQEEYYSRLRQQQSRLRNVNNDYNNDPYYYTAPSFRYNRAGTYYQTNQYGADLLRQAVNYGFQEGFHAGQADRQDRWRSNYQGSYAYQDANYGYDGRYVQQSEYNYYFREGFRRGYQDGYNNGHQYGISANGNYGISGTVLSLIINLQSLR